MVSEGTPCQYVEDGKPCGKPGTYWEGCKAYLCGRHGVMVANKREQRLPWPKT